MSPSEAPAAIDDLVSSVLEITGTPVDPAGVAATLESQGMRDLDAAQRFSRRDVFELADEVFNLARLRRPATASWAQPAPRPRITVRTFLGKYGRGAFSFFPLLLQLFMVLTVGYSQWGWIHFSLYQASIVALGVGLALLGTGPAINVLGYFGPSFVVQGKHLLTRRITLRVLLLGMLGAALLAAAISVVALATGAIPRRTLGIALAYDGLVSTLSLLNGTLYMLKRQALIIVSLALSLPVVGIVLNETGWGIYAAHWLGLGAAILVDLIAITAILQRRARATTAEMRLARLPRRMILARIGAPFALYGLGYFVILLGDRGFAWSVGEYPLPIWFNVRYELGMDFAMLATAAGIAFLECIIFMLGRRALPEQQRFSGQDSAAHNRWYLRFHRFQLLAVAALLALGTATVVGVLAELHHRHGLSVLAPFYSDPVTRRVFFIGAAGLALVTVGLANCSVLFVVARPWYAAGAVLAAALVDGAVGFALSRTLGFSYAVVGLLAGGAVFALVSARLVSRVLRSADYFLYTAY